MNCPQCGAANRPGARFCRGCGGSLGPRCTSCGADVRPESRFCDGCGAPVDERAAESRKTVTILFADLAGSTSLQERLDPESARRDMDRLFALLRDETR